jgi:hypothetical protein
MNRIIGILLVLTGLQTACTEDEFTRFDSAENSAINIVTKDVLISNFFYVNSDTDTLFFDVQLVGSVADYDRYFRLGTVDSLTTAQEGIHFEPFKEQLLPAGEYTATVKVVTLRHDDLKDSTLTLNVNVIANEYFKGNMLGHGGLEIEMTDIDEPVWWKMNNGNLEKYYWGRYHAKKLELMYFLYKVPYEDRINWVPPINQISLFFSNLSYMKKYFEENAYYHKDGERVSIPYNSY